MSKLITLLFLSISLVAQDKPNIVFIMADDLGWSDVGINGAEFYETPNFDRLAKNGMLMKQAYASGPNCTPSRACLMSGTFTPRHQMWTPNARSKGPANKMKLLVPNRDNSKGDIFPSKMELSSDVISLAEVLNQAGYESAMMGKWHLGEDQQGFDLFTSNGKDSGIHKHYGSTSVADTLTDRAVQFIKENKNKPFFLYLSHWDVHTPIRAKKEVVQKYQKKLKAQKWDHKWNPTYAAMIEAFDKSLGKVQKTLDDLKLSEKTLFIVTSDNGAIGQVATGPLKGAKGSFFEGGIRVPTLFYWPSQIKAGSSTSTPIASVDFKLTFADLAGVKLSDKQPVDGVSLLPLIKGQKLADRNLFWHYPLYLISGGKAVIPIYGKDKAFWRITPSSMIRRGPWKLIYFFETDTVQLYNIDQDPYEQKDLAQDSPETAQKLLSELKKFWQESSAVLPKKINEDFNAESQNKKSKKKKKKKK